MTIEWIELPTLVSVCNAQTDGWEIECHGTAGGWCSWNEISWHKDLRYRARPKQPKMKKVKVLGWLDPSCGSTFTAFEDANHATWCIRYPNIDGEVEVPDDN